MILRAPLVGGLLRSVARLRRAERPVPRQQPIAVAPGDVVNWSVGTLTDADAGPAAFVPTSPTAAT
jgi:hypothetical protein